MADTPRRRARRGGGEALRGQIMYAAKTLLARHGTVESVSIRAVADLVGVTPPSIYLHFADKDALIDAVVAEVFTELDDRMKAGPADAHPLDRLCYQGMAYIRFALESPGHYLLATANARTESGDVDMVLRTAAFTRLRDTVEDCMAEGVFTPGDPTPVAIQLWAAAHGIASLIIAKPYLPWGDPDEIAYRVLGAAAMGISINGYLDDPDPAAFVAWRKSLPSRSDEGGSTG